MSGIVSAVVVDKATGGHLGIGDTFDAFTGKSAADAATEAAGISAAAQIEQLNYLKEINALPQQYKEQALEKLAGIYGLNGDISGQQKLIEQAKASPIYAATMSGLGAGEESILRNAAATGGLRSGNTQSAISEFGTRLSNEALVNAYNQQLSGIQGLANVPTNEGQIGSTIAGIGETYAQGITSSAQARQQGLQNTFNTLLGIGGLIL